MSWLWSRASHNGCCSNGAFAADIHPGGDLVPADDVMRSWIGGVQVKEVVSYGFRRQQHINLLEMQAHKRRGPFARQNRWRAGGPVMLDSWTRASSSEPLAGEGVRRGSSTTS